ncbi:hypothetical protein [Kitasatospora sp. NPDC088351]|uniref:hypothetical protein n=1 Tax=Kitasatospora sp. NPDC088351 TaxID=3155180 RepID=UPI003432D1E2
MKPFTPNSSTRGRIWRTGAVNREWDGTWTVAGFSLPGAWRRERHDLRSRLVRGGLAPLQSGLWTAPGEVDVAALVEGLGLEGHLRVFHGRAAARTEAAGLPAAFDLASAAVGYRAFLARWGGAEPGAPAEDDLARRLLLHTD